MQVNTWPMRKKVQANKIRAYLFLSRVSDMDKAEANLRVIT